MTDMHILYRKSTFVLVIITMWLLASCGFHLRDPSPMPFKTIYLPGQVIKISPELTQELQNRGVAIVENQDIAEAMLDIISEQNNQRILSLSGQGVVLEYEISYRVTYRTRLANEATWSPPLVMEARRDYLYNNTVLLSKQGEEKGLADDMRSDVTNGILRRLSALKKAE